MILSVTPAAATLSFSCSGTAVLSDQRIGSNDLDADKYFDPLQAACETRQTRLMEIALEGIKYLIGKRMESLSLDVCLN